MSKALYTNNAVATLSAGITAVQTSIALTTGQGALFPTPSGSDYFYATLVDALTQSVLEIVKCTARSGDTLTVVRGVQSTTANAYLAGDRLELRPTAYGFAELLAAANNLSDIGSVLLALENLGLTGAVGGVLLGAGAGVVPSYGKAALNTLDTTGAVGQVLAGQGSGNAPAWGKAALNTLDTTGALGQVLTAQGAGNAPAWAVSSGVAAVIQSLAAPSVVSNTMTLGWNPAPLMFRNASLAAGIPVTMPEPGAALSITLPSGATLGEVSGQPMTLILLVAYNGGSPVLCVVNLAGGVDLSETGFISPTTISNSSTSASTVYSASTVAANSQYRVVGGVTMTQATAGTYVTLPSLVVGEGGEAFAALMSAGYGQNWVSYSRAPNTTYYNATNKIRWICPVIAGTASGTGTATVFVWNAPAGVYVQAACLSTFGGSSFCGFPIPVPPGASYYLGTITGSAVYNSWTEMA